MSPALRITAVTHWGAALRAGWQQSPRILTLRVIKVPLLILRTAKPEKRRLLVEALSVLLRAGFQSFLSALHDASPLAQFLFVDAAAETVA